MVACSGSRSLFGFDFVGQNRCKPLDIGNQNPSFPEIPDSDLKKNLPKRGLNFAHPSHAKPGDYQEYVNNYAGDYQKYLAGGSDYQKFLEHGKQGRTERVECWKPFLAETVIP